MLWKLLPVKLLQHLRLGSLGGANFGSRPHERSYYSDSVGRTCPTATVDISSLLKGPDSNEAPVSPQTQQSQQNQQQPQSTSTPSSATPLGPPGPSRASLSSPTAAPEAVAVVYPAQHPQPPRPLTAPPGPPTGPSPTLVASIAAVDGPVPPPPGPGLGVGAVSVSEGLRVAAAGLRAANAAKRAMDSRESPAKKQSKWSPDEDALIIELRGSGMKWEDISKRLPGRSAISCRLHYQNYLERRSEWDEERKNKLARLYER